MPFVCELGLEASDFESRSHEQFRGRPGQADAHRKPRGHVSLGGELLDVARDFEPLSGKLVWELPGCEMLGRVHGSVVLSVLPHEGPRAELHGASVAGTQDGRAGGART